MQWRVGPFRLDRDDACLWQGDERVVLRPKTFDLLLHLVEHAGELVTKDNLLAAMWPETAVTEGALSVRMSELRKVLGETAKDPQFIATVHRRGYRLIAPVEPIGSPMTSVKPATPFDGEAPSSFRPPVVAPAPAAMLIEREGALAQLHQRLRTARDGQRQLLFVTGEAGIGKTTLVDAFVEQVASSEPIWTARGQCIEQYGVGEAYLPLLEALGQLGRRSDGRGLVEILYRQAPSWLLQLPALVDDDAYEALQRRTSGATRERMLRELAEAMETLTTTQALVLVLEDLHWSDMSTIEWLGYMARRRSTAQLLILGTYRPVEALVHAHPVHAMLNDLQVRGQGDELALEYLSASGVVTYLRQRLGGETVPAALAQVLHQRTTGNPLFLVTMVEALIRQGLLQPKATGWELTDGIEAVSGGLPVNLRQLIEQQMRQLAPESQRILEAASVAGTVFGVAEVAAGVGCPIEEIEDPCEALARRGQFLRAHDTKSWPDGTLTARYRFMHALYQEVLYDRVPVSRRVRWHRQIGARLEAGYGPQANEIAAELAEHFMRGRELACAVPYLQQAGEQAIARSANREAVMRYEQALEALQQLPQTHETRTQAIDLHLALRTALIPLGDSAAIFIHMRAAAELAEQLGDVDRQGRIAVYWTRDLGVMSRHEEAVTWGQRALALSHGDVTLRMTTQLYLSYTYVYIGSYQDAVSILHDAFAAIDDLPPHARLGAALPAVALRHGLIQALTELGQFDDARRYGQEALQIAESAGHLFSLYQIVSTLASLYLCQGAFDAAIPLLQQSLDLCQEADLPYGVPHTVCRLGWAYAQTGRPTKALPYLEQAEKLIASRRTGGRYAMWLLLLSEAYVAIGHLARVRPLVQEALSIAQERQERGFQGYALRLLGEIAGHGDAPDLMLATTHYRQALDLANELGMRPLQAHCYCGLGILYAKTGQAEQARAALTTAIDLYRAMVMTFWLPRAQEALAGVEGG